LKRPDPTRRFSDRVANYVRYRPGYPEALLATLVSEAGLGPESGSGSAVADVGSGTGISTELLLRAGGEVYAVEPNAEMRAAAEARLGGEPRFHSVAGTAEATTLPSASVDLVAAGQAFHWFDVERTRAELARILRDTPAGRAQVALFWNSRRTDASPFLRAYEELLQRFGTDYAEVDHTKIGADTLERFFGERYEKLVFLSHQDFDSEGLQGRLLSSSYAPGPGHPHHEPMLAALRRIFDQNQEEGRVRFVYDTKLYLGRLHGRPIDRRSRP
jgi:ubiquinone/menaquinone biosynthesis C-methylase UbiE